MRKKVTASHSPVIPIKQRFLVGRCCGDCSLMKGVVSPSRQYYRPRWINILIRYIIFSHMKKLDKHQFSTHQFCYERSSALFAFPFLFSQTTHLALLSILYPLSFVSIYWLFFWTSFFPAFSSSALYFVCTNVSEPTHLYTDTKCNTKKDKLWLEEITSPHGVFGLTVSPTLFFKTDNWMIQPLGYPSSGKEAGPGSSKVRGCLHGMFPIWSRIC